MGADLYIESISIPAREKAEPAFRKACEERNVLAEVGDEAALEVAQERVAKLYEAMYPKEGYFRDSYNATSLLSQLGLSWWRDVIPLQDEEGYLQPDNCRTLLAMIEARPMPRLTEASLREDGSLVEDEGENSVQGWQQYFDEKRDDLIAFLKRAIEMDEAVYTSL